MPNALVQGSDESFTAPQNWAPPISGARCLKQSTAGGSTFRTLHTFGLQGNGNDGANPAAALGAGHKRHSVGHDAIRRQRQWHRVQHYHQRGLYQRLFFR